MKNNEPIKYKTEEIAINGKRQRQGDYKETKEMKAIRILCYSFLVMITSAVLLLSTSVLAQEETIELRATYPRIESAAPEAVFKFTVSLTYRGEQARAFDLRPSGPPGWNTYVTSFDESSRISIIRLEPNKSTPYRVKVITSPLPSTMVTSKDYRITLEAISGKIRDSIELVAVAMPMYSLELLPRSDYYYREATAGEDNFFTITVRNAGSGELTGIKFSAHEPRDWTIEFQPGEIDRLAPGGLRRVEVIIKPASNTADRYHDVTLIAESRQARQTTNFRVRVEEPKGFWMWIGGAIAVLVIGAFTLIFLRLSRNK
jgi:uncharacterized membrane protein